MRALVRKSIFAVGVVMLLSTIHIIPGTTLHVQAKKVKATTAETLNNALGGNHKVKGNTVILQSDVALDSLLDISGNLTLDMNGKTVSKAEGKDSKFDVGDEKEKCVLKLTGSGKLEPKITVRKNGTLKISGNVDVRRVENGGGKVIVENGNVSDLNSYYYGSEVTVTGGQIDDFEQCWPDGDIIFAKLTVKGGVVKKLFSSGEVYVKGGEIGDMAGISMKVVISGGVIKGQVSASEFKMTGGTIYSSGSPAVEIGEDSDFFADGRWPTMRMSGGKIITTKKNACGIKIYDAKAVLTGGQIINTSKSGKCGVYASSLKDILKSGNLTDKSLLTVYWKAEKSKTLKITGFKEGFKKASGRPCVILRNTKLSTPKMKGKIFTAGNKMKVNAVKGNIKLSYKN